MMLTRRIRPALALTAALLAASAGLPSSAGLPDCPDADGDGFQDCAPGSLCNPTGPCGDCDDADAAVSPAAIESCDGTDEDCNGVADDEYVDSDADTRADCVDCDPFDISTWAKPGLTDSLRFPGSTGLTWSKVPSSTLANLYRGTLGAGSAWGYNQTCLASGLVAGEYDDAAVPAPGSLFFYLVEGLNSCGLGGFAAATDGPRLSLAPCLVLPVDGDEDGIDDIDDNCPLVANEEQFDVDLDGHGDMCDTCVSVYNPDQLPTCSGNGECTPGEIAGTSQCLCDPGFTGENCENVEPMVAAEFLELPEPDGWETDGTTGLVYRRATIDERRRHGWLPGTYLVQAPGLASAVGQGSATVELLVPTGDGTTRTVFFDLTRPGSPEGEVIEVRAQGQKAIALTTTPNFFDYLSRPSPNGPPDEIVKLSVVERGGGVLHGRVGDYEMAGYTPIRPLDVLQSPGVAPPPSPVDPAHIVPMTLLNPTPGTQADWNDCHGEGICGAYCTNNGLDTPCTADDSPNPCCQPWDPDGGPADDCHDNFDNDDDGFVDADGDGLGAPNDSSCLHSAYCNGPAHEHLYESGKQFILQGDVNLCTDLVVEKGLDWRVELRQRASSIVHSGFELETGHAPFDGLAQLPLQVLRWVAIKCWILDDEAAARNCKNGDVTDCGPFQGAHAYPYAGSGDNAAGYMGEYARADLVHSVDVGLTQPVNLVHVVMATDQGDPLISSIGNTIEGESQGAYSVAKWSDTFAVEKLSVSVHEMGHSLGLTHCHAAMSPVDGACTVMGDSSNAGGGVCQLATICEALDHVSRFSPSSGETLYNGVRNGATLPYHFGNEAP